jgi:hypothetical protein
MQSPFRWTEGALAPAATLAPAFDLEHWYGVFSQPQLAGLSSPVAGTLAFAMAWLDVDQLISLVWDTVDTWDHAWFAYSARADYSGLVWTFDIQIDSTVIPFDQSNGLTLTVQMGDGTQKVVRLWNYKTAGSATSATFRVDFSHIAAGFFADQPFTCTNVAKIFLTFVNLAFGAGTKLAAYQYSTATISNSSVTGPGLNYAATQLPVHHLEMTIDYDNVYHLHPGRVVDQIAGLGYTQFCTCYIGMSHFFNIGWDSGEARFRFLPSAAPVNAIALAWLTDFYARLKAHSIALVFSMSYELLASYAPTGWSQLNYTGAQALTGWVPPSTLLAFTLPAVMTHFRSVIAQLLTIPAAVGAKYFQIGEPWWWDGSYSDDKPCFYDAATQALYLATYGAPMYQFTSVFDPVTDSSALQTASFLNAQLGLSTETLGAYIRSLGAQCAVLFDVSQAFAARLTQLVNYPKAAWKWPAYDFFQIESYDTIITGDLGKHNREVLQVLADLGYPLGLVHYFGGFVLTNNAAIWANIFDALDDTSKMGLTNLALWSFTQVTQDGIVVSWAPTETYAPGVDPQLVLRCSNDGGKTWGNERQAAMGQLGNYKQLARWRQLGRAMNRVFEVSCSEPVFVALIAADLDAHG